MRENQIQQFQNQHFGKLTVIEIDSEFFFIGKEVAELLGYKNGSRDVNRHVDEEDRCIFQNYQNGTFENIPNRGVTIINESGLYSLILLSKLPSAKAFKHWVTKEVLPSVRKHGGYLKNQEEQSNEVFVGRRIHIPPVAPTHLKNQQNSVDVEHGLCNEDPPRGRVVQRTLQTLGRRRHLRTPRTLPWYQKWHSTTTTTSRIPLIADVPHHFPPDPPSCAVPSPASKSPYAPASTRAHSVISHPVTLPYP